MATMTKPEYILELTEEERTELVTLLEEALQATHLEKRRTESPAYQERVGHEESLLRTLAEKVRRLRS
jgi:hypothetical protein